MNVCSDRHPDPALYELGCLLRAEVHNLGERRGRGQEEAEEAQEGGEDGGGHSGAGSTINQSIKTRVALDTDLAGYSATGYPANNFAGPSNTGYPTKKNLNKF